MLPGIETSDGEDTGHDGVTPIALTASAPPRKRAEARIETPATVGPPTTYGGQLYHVRSFMFVVCEALAHHAHLLRHGEADVVCKFMRPGLLSTGAIDLFTRVYRRKHEQWLPEAGLLKRTPRKCRPILTWRPRLPNLCSTVCFIRLRRRGLRRNVRRRCNCWTL